MTKQLLYRGLQEYVLDLCSKGRISIGKAAEVLELSIYDIHNLAEEREIVLSASEDQVKKSQELLSKLIKKK
ncbi:hypothetical protein HYY69_04645 [Candidatus Woesearchaeota archaeon]|nr:hypothetical protein [Candidatus Woesearchaeota archaeon]